MEREVGGGIGMGKTCKLKAVSFQCMTKFTTNLKKKRKEKKKELSICSSLILIKDFPMKNRYELSPIRWAKVFYLFFFLFV